MFGNKHYSDAIDAVSTSRLHPLGDLREYRHATYGSQIWRYVYNDEAATAFAVGNVIARDTGGTTLADGILSPAAEVVRARLLGVAQHTIAAGSFGWICCYGNCQVLAGVTNGAADIPVKTDAGTAGRAEAAAVGANDAPDAAAIFGWAAETSTDGSLFVASINCL